MLQELTKRYDEPRLYVDGRWVEGHGTPLDVENPATEEHIGRVTTSSPEDVDAAVAAARRAFDEGPWPRLSGRERADALLRLADVLARRQDEMAERLVDDLGCPVSQVKSFQIGRTVEHWRDLAALAATPDTEPIMPVPGSYQPALVVHEPIGVVAAITAYNYPFMILTWKVGMALAAGCTVVYKPAEIDPLLAFEFLRAVEEAELPPGTVNLVLGGPDTGRMLVSHPDVDAVSLTGSVAVGEDVLRHAASGIKKVVLELGGKSPAVVLDDADVDALVPKVAYGFVLNTGQACAATTRLLVAESRYDEVLEKVIAATAAIPVGDPRDPHTVVGPLVSERQRARVESYLATVAEHGGEIVLGGGRPAGLDRGYYVEPTIVTGVSNDAPVAREEIFGPVLTVLRHRDDDEAIAIANDSPYGLAAVVYGSRRRAMRVGRAIRAGTVCINQGAFNPHAPIGGYKASGLGREGGTWGLEEFREVKHLTWA